VRLESEKFDLTELLEKRNREVDRLTGETDVLVFLTDTLSVLPVLLLEFTVLLECSKRLQYLTCVSVIHIGSVNF